MVFNPATQIIQSAATRTLKKVAGNLPGLLGLRPGKGGDTSSFAPLSRSAKSPNVYSFPIDVTADPGNGNHGHYMMFFINEQKDALLKFGSKQSGAANMAKEKQARNIPKFIIEMQEGGGTQKKNNSGATGQLGNPTQAANNSKTKAKGSTVFVKRPPTTRMDTAIALYMPATAQVSYKASYTDTPIGVGAAAAVDVYQGLMDKSVSAKSVMTKILDKGGNAIKETLKTGFLDGIGAMPGMAGTREAVEMQQGFILADRMELAFKGVDKRSFTYSFKMIPRNEEEADEIRKIVFAFKANMLPEFVKGDRTGRSMKMPNTFDIQYMYNGKENDYLHKISTCVLNSVDVKQGGSKYKTFTANDQGAPPVETELTLSFQELEIITREKVFEGF